MSSLVSFEYSFNFNLTCEIMAAALYSRDYDCGAVDIIELMRLCFCNFQNVFLYYLPGYLAKFYYCCARKLFQLCVSTCFISRHCPTAIAICQFLSSFSLPPYITCICLLFALSPAYVDWLRYTVKAMALTLSCLAIPIIFEVRCRMIWCTFLTLTCTTFVTVMRCTIANVVVHY